MFCVACGNRMGDGDRFCARCGTRRAVIPEDGIPNIAASPQAPAPEPVAPAPAIRVIRSTADIAQPRASAASTPLGRIPEQPVTRLEEPATEAAHTAARIEKVTYYPPPVEPEEQPPLFHPDPVRADAPAANVVGIKDVRVPFAASPYEPDKVPVAENRGLSPVIIGAIVVALIALGGIGWMLRTMVSSSPKSAATSIEVTLVPEKVQVAAGKPVDFAAAVTGAPAAEVIWRVQEGDAAGQVTTHGAYAKGGTVSQYATYTAPKQPGTYHLVVSSDAVPGKSASSEITVVAAPSGKQK